MSAGRMIGSLLGAFGGRALGGMLGGSTGRMIGSMAGSMLAGRAAGGGGLGSLLGGGSGGGLGAVLGSIAGGGDDGGVIADDEAKLLIRAMCNAAKADGHVDDAEIDAIVSRAGDLDAEDEAYLRAELNSPLDTAGLVASVPDGLGPDVYMASLLAVEVDTAEEVGYMDDLARQLGVDGDTRLQIHEALGLES